VVDLPEEIRAELTRLLTVDGLPKQAEIADRAKAIACLIYETDADNAPAAVMIGGAPWMMAHLVKALRDEGVVQCLASFSRRDSVERTDPSSLDVIKTTVFRHIGFVECGL
jgi:predicted phage tail protein